MFGPAVVAARFSFGFVFEWASDPDAYPGKWAETSSSLGLAQQLPKSFRPSRRGYVARKNEFKDGGEVNMEVATETCAKPSPSPTKEGSAKVAVEMCTDAILAGLKQREAEKTKGRIQAVAKSKSKATGKRSRSRPSPIGATDKAKGKIKACAAKVVPTIAKPKPGKPVCFGQCTIMHAPNRWRVTTAENRRYDKGFSFKTPGAWDELVKYCVANK